MKKVVKSQKKIKRKKEMKSNLYINIIIIVKNYLVSNFFLLYTKYNKFVFCLFIILNENNIY
jgi:uncharacterized membrane protein YwzB